MEILILWFLCAVITAHVAAEKNRSALGWFLLGCASGSFALILIASVAKLPSRADIAADKRAFAEFLKPKKQCPECAETILQVARICRYCGCRFAAEPVSRAPSLSSPPLDASLSDLSHRPGTSRRIRPVALAEAGILEI